MDQPLYIECETCDGEGRYKPDYLAATFDHKVECNNCDASGYVITPAGEHVLTFMKLFLRIGFRE